MRWRVKYFIKNTTMTIHFTTNNKQNVNVIFTSINSHILTIRLFNSYNHKKMRHKICKWYEFTRLFFIFWVPIAISAGKISYPYLHPSGRIPAGKIGISSAVTWGGCVCDGSVSCVWCRSAARGVKLEAGFCQHSASGGYWEPETATQGRRRKT